MATVTRGKIQRGDLALYDGKNSTSARPDATGGTVTGLRIGDEVDVLQIYGEAANRTRGSLANAIQRIGGSKATLTLAPGTWTIEDDLTIPSNFNLRVPAGCIVSVSANKTLTISGTIIADRPADLYTGSGTVTVSNEGSHFGSWFISAAEATASVTPSDFSYPEGNIRRYGAVMDGATDDSTALQTAHDALPSTGGLIYIPNGTTLAKSVTWTKQNITVRCDGVIQPADTDEGFVLELDIPSAPGTFGINGNLRFDSGVQGEDLANDISALYIRQLRNADLHVTAEGFTKGLDIQFSGGVSYNIFRLGDFVNTIKGVHIRPSSPDTGFCNENMFIAGRFSQDSSVTWTSDLEAIVIDDASSTPNGNKFYGPSVEFGMVVFNCSARQNAVYNARYESHSGSSDPGTDTTDRIVNFAGPLNHCSILSNNTPAYTGYIESVGVATRVTDQAFTLASANRTDYFFPGNICVVTVSATPFKCRILHSVFVGGDTTVRIDRSIVTDDPTDVSVGLFRVDSPTNDTGNSIEIGRVDGNAVADYASLTTQHRQLIQLIESSLIIKGRNSDFPALILMPGEANSDKIIRGVNLNGAPVFNVDGTGVMELVVALRFGLDSAPLIRSGTGSPEGAIGAPVGSLFLRDDGGMSTTLYVKESGTGNTGWVAK